MYIYLRSQCLMSTFVVIRLFRSVSGCPYGKEGLVGDKICNSPWLMNRVLPKMSTPKMSAPRMSTPKKSTPRISTSQISTPKMSTPKIYILTKYTIYIFHSLIRLLHKQEVLISIKLALNCVVHGMVLCGNGKS